MDNLFVVHTITSSSSFECSTLFGWGNYQPAVTEDAFALISWLTTIFLSLLRGAWCIPDGVAIQFSSSKLASSDAYSSANFCYSLLCFVCTQSLIAPCTFINWLLILAALLVSMTWHVCVYTGTALSVLLWNILCNHFQGRWATYNASTATPSHHHFTLKPCFAK